MCDITNEIKVGRYNNILVIINIKIAFDDMSIYKHGDTEENYMDIFKVYTMCIDIEQKSFEDKQLFKQCMGIVNQLFDLAEVCVEKRQAINDKADEYIFKQIKNIIKK